MTDPLELHGRALADVADRVHAVAPEGWHAPTPDEEWDVRELVAHLVNEQLWVPPLLAGQTVAKVGDRFDGDVLGNDPVRAWDDAAAAARAAFTQPGAVDRTVHLSSSDSSAQHYLWQMTTDLVVHGWDLARGAGLDERLDDELVQVVYDRTAPDADQLASSGLFAPVVTVAEDAPLQTKMLALFGRRA